MNLNVLILFITLLYNYTYSQQNLVTNGSFEEYYSCPNNVGQLDNCKNVFNPTGFASSPDYFNSCDIILNNVSTPNNFRGIQIPYHGNAYCGFYSFILGIQSYHEYLQIKLNKKY